MRWDTAWVYAIADGVPHRALWVALVVAAVRNLINQGDALVAGRSISSGWR